MSVTNLSVAGTKQGISKSSGLKGPLVIPQEWAERMLIGRTKNYLHQVAGGFLSSNDWANEWRGTIQNNTYALLTTGSWDYTNTVYVPPLKQMFRIAGNGTTTSTYALDVTVGATGTWTSKANQPLASMFGMIAVYDPVNVRIYVVGRDINNTNTAVYYYDPLANTWSSALSTTGLTNSSYGCAMYRNGKIYLLGGSNAGTAINNTQIYDIASNTWSAGTSSAASIGTHYGTAFGVPETGPHAGKMVLIGGYNGSMLTHTSYYIFDPDGNSGAGSWSSQALTIPQTYSSDGLAYVRSYGQLSACVGHWFLLFGGNIVNSGNAAEHYAIDTLNNIVYQSNSGVGGVLTRNAAVYAGTIWGGSSTNIWGRTVPGGVYATTLQLLAKQYGTV